MIIFLICLLYSDLNITPTGKILEHSLFEKPIQVEIYDGNEWVLDRKAKCLFFMKSGQRIGRGGQGPGEFLDPTAFKIDKTDLYVYDSMRGTLTKFDLSGVYRSSTNLVRASGAFFFENSITLQTPFGKNLFVKYDFDGNIINSFGKGMNQNMDIKNIQKYVRIFALSQDVGLIFLSPDGNYSSTFKAGIRKNLTLDYDYKILSLPQKVSKGSSFSFTIDFGQPILDVEIADKLIFILVEDENENEVTYLQVFNMEGKLLNMQQLDSYFQKLNIRKNKIYLFDTNEARIVIYSFKL